MQAFKLFPQSGKSVQKLFFYIINRAKVFLFPKVPPQGLHSFLYKLNSCALKLLISSSIL